MVFFRKTKAFDPRAVQHLPSPPVSIIICAKNEEENLKKNLPFILQQKYDAPFEVLVVNDRSTDNTNQVLETYAQEYSYIRIITINNNTSTHLKGKKYALQTGILAASYNQLLLTDADCQPNSQNWLSLMTAPFKSGFQISYGYGPYQTEDTMLNRCVQYETLMTATQYFSHFWWDFPYMGIGRNLAYHRKIFFEAKGFENIGHLTSGDDDLFISKIGSQQPSSAVLHSDSFMYSKAPKNWRSWYIQKQRHLSTGWHYKWVHQFSLGLFIISHFFFYISIVLNIFVGIGSVFATSLVFVKLIVQLVIAQQLLKIFQSPLSLYQFMFWDVLFSFYHLIFGFTSFKRITLWK